MSPFEVRAIRERLGLTQQQMADILCVHRIQLIRLETGKSRVHRKHVANYLHIQRLGEIALARRNKLDWSL